MFNDCAAMKGLFSKSIADIRNHRLQRMLESIAGYKIHIVHVKGENHTVADRLSRYPLSMKLAPDFSVSPPQICNRSMRLMRSGVDIKDPLLERLSVMAEEDSEYQSILKDLGQSMEPRDLNENSPLKKKEGDLGRLLI